jgi:hypothetical protein
MYNSDQTFGGISILLIGNFIQLPVTAGRDLWGVMYGTVSGNDGTARNLFQQFCVKELTVNIHHLNVNYIRREWQVSVPYHKCIHLDKNGLQKITNYTNQ